MSVASDHDQLIHLGGDAFCHPALEPLLVPIGEVSPHPENPRNGDQDAITDSIRELGLYQAVRVQRSTGHILAGNHTTMGLLELGAERVPVIWLDVDDKRARHILLRDNHTSDLGRYDEGLLLQLLTDLQAEGELSSTGYTEDELIAIAESQAQAVEDEIDPDETRAPTTSEMLAVADVTWGEPDHKVRHGQVWRVGPHLLIIAKVSTEFDQWAGYLGEDVMFCPYPEPYITTTEAAETHNLLLVQPNPYLAGHLLDKHASTHPDQKIRLLPTEEDE